MDFKVGDSIKFKGLIYQVMEIVSVHRTDYPGRTQDLRCKSIANNVYTFWIYNDEVESADKNSMLLSKIKYLDERKVLDKSRIVPPKGIYRGTRNVPEVPEVREAGEQRQGVAPTIPSLRFIDSATIERYLAEFSNSSPVDERTTLRVTPSPRQYFFANGVTFDHTTSST